MASAVCNPTTSCVRRNRTRPDLATARSAATLRFAKCYCSTVLLCNFISLGNKARAQRGFHMGLGYRGAAWTGRGADLFFIPP